MARCHPPNEPKVVNLVALAIPAAVIGTLIELPGAPVTMLSVAESGPIASSPMRRLSLTPTLLEGMIQAAVSPVVGQVVEWNCRRRLLT